MNDYFIFFLECKCFVSEGCVFHDIPYLSTCLFRHSHRTNVGVSLVRHVLLILNRNMSFEWHFSRDIREALKKTMTTRIIGDCPAKASLGRIGYF